MTNSPRFRTIGNNASARGGRGFGLQQQEQQQYQPQQGYNAPYGNRDDEPVVAWLNISVAGRHGDKKKLGKGIPLRESFQLERAILDLFFDENGELTDFDPVKLRDALHLEVRPAGQPDAEFEIDLFGDEPAPKTRRDKAAEQLGINPEPQEDPAPEETAAPKRPARARLTQK